MRNPLKMPVKPAVSPKKEPDIQPAKEPAKTVAVFHGDIRFKGGPAGTYAFKHPHQSVKPLRGG